MSTTAANSNWDVISDILIASNIDEIVRNVCDQHYRRAADDDINKGPEKTPSDG